MNPTSEKQTTQLRVLVAQYLLQWAATSAAIEGGEEAFKRLRIKRKTISRWPTSLISGDRKAEADAIQHAQGVLTAGLKDLRGHLKVIERNIALAKRQIAREGR